MIQMANKSLHFTEPGSLVSSQEPSTGPYTGPDEPNQFLDIIFLSFFLSCWLHTNSEWIICNCAIHIALDSSLLQSRNFTLHGSIIPIVTKQAINRGIALYCHIPFLLIYIIEWRSVHSSSCTFMQITGHGDPFSSNTNCIGGWSVHSSDRSWIRFAFILRVPPVSDNRSFYTSIEYMTFLSDRNCLIHHAVIYYCINYQHRKWVSMPIC
jgi:hypothetical protein